MNLNTSLVEFNNTIGLISEQYPWQWPAATEQFYFTNHLFRSAPQGGSNLYIAFPWAKLIDQSLIDLKAFELFVSSPPFNDLKQTIEKKRALTHTVCQHIYWQRLIPIWEELNINQVHVCHFERNLQFDCKLIFNSWPLLATNHEIPARRKGLEIKPQKSKKYIASFMGAHCHNYRSDIRIKLKEAFHDWGRADVRFELAQEWFYEKLVYDHQLHGLAVEDNSLNHLLDRTQEYNEILSDSVFSLCPEGSGPNTIRVWESLAAGSIPVIYSDQWIPPILPGLNWRDFSVFIPQTDYRMTLDILNSYDIATLNKMQLNCLNAYNQFSKMLCF